MDILREFLNAFWLRPEVALIKTHEYMALEQMPFDEPAIDIGCGDGIFSFICAGGRFGADFDMFTKTSREQIVSLKGSMFLTTLMKSGFPWILPKGLTV